MPIKPENMTRYPGGSIKSPEWRAIRKRIGERSGWRCETCGAPHMTMIARGTYRGRDAYMVLDSCEVFDAETGLRMGQMRCTSEFGAQKVLKVVLTVAHRGLPAHLPLLLHVTRNADTDEVFEAVGFFMPLDAESLEWRAMMHNRALSQLLRSAAADRACFAIAFPREAASFPPTRAIVPFGTAAPIWVRLTGARVLSDEDWKAAGIPTEAPSRADMKSADGIGLAAPFADGFAKAAFDPAAMDEETGMGARLLLLPRCQGSNGENLFTNNTRPLAVAFSGRATNAGELLAKSPRAEIGTEAIRRACLSAELVRSDFEALTANFAGLVSRGFSRACHALLYHFDEYEENCRDENLAHLCQRHHLRLDAKHHARNAARTRRNRGGQLDMEDFL